MKNKILSFWIFILLFISSNISAQNTVYVPLYTNSTFTKTINTSLPVGTTAATANVSNGAATYQIPLLIPPGTNGVQPELSIAYNSFGGNGQMGLGWGLTGLSSITRVNKNIYFDGEVKPIEITSNDKFALDGQRLIGLTGTYGSNAATYGTEYEAFATITSYGTCGSGPCYFQVETKEGIIMEYGNSTDSKFLKNTTVVSWLLNKVRYKDGNYIEYKYLTTNDEPRIDEILYTGNSTSLTPYNKLKFYYSERNDYNKLYVGGKEIQVRYLLDKIVITTENVTSKTYEFKYGNNNIISYLVEVIEKGSAGTQLNSTIFKYGDQPTEFSTDVPTNYFLNNQDVEIIPGDFNGDGKTDILAATWAIHTENNISFKYHPSFVIYTRSSPDGLFAPAYSYVFNPNEYFQIIWKGKQPNQLGIQASDYNGDGLDDIMINKLSAPIGGGEACIVESFNLFTSNFSNGNLTFTVNTIMPYISTTSGCLGPYNYFGPNAGDGQFFFPGDFNGDGATDFITILGGAGGYKAFISFPKLNLYHVQITNINSGCYISDWVWLGAKFHNVIDFDGDGKAELMMTNGNVQSKTKIYTFQPDGSNYKAITLYDAGFPTVWHRFFCADFNGDGKTDILARNDPNNTNNPWTIGINNGTIFNETSFSFNYAPVLTENDDDFSDDLFIIADFNGDGKSDIFMSRPLGSPYAIKDIYYSKGNSFYLSAELSNSNLNLSSKYNNAFDLNGDGRADFVNRQGLGTLVFYYIKKNGQENLMQKIKNGIDYDVSFNYLNMTNSQIYTKGTTSSFPLIDIKAPLYLVQNIGVEDGIGGYIYTQYLYEEAKLHKQGKGFIGFKKIIANSSSSGIKNISENEFITSNYIALPKKSMTYRLSGNTLINEITNTNLIVDKGNKRFWNKITNIYQNKAMEGGFVNTDLLYDDYGNVTASTTNTNNIESAVITSVFGQYGTPVPSKPTSITKSNTRSGQTVYSTTSTYQYNSLGQLTSNTDFSTKPKSVTTNYTYDSYGNILTSTISPTGMTARTTTYTYEAKKRFKASVKNTLDQTASFTYDGKWGAVLTTTGVDGLTTTNTYDEFGRLLTTIPPALSGQSFTISNTYGWDINTVDNTISYKQITHPGEPDVKVWVDIIGREVKKQVESSQSTTTLEKTTYDSKGNVLTKTVPFKTGESYITSNFSYDDINRITSTTDNLQRTSSYVYSFLSGNSTVTITAPGNQVSSKKTDATGKVIEATDGGGTLYYTYYSHGNPKEIKLGTTVMVANEYDDYARQTKLTDINAGITTYATDALGQITSSVNANNQTLVYSYDVLGRKTYYGRSEGSSSYEYYTSGNGAKTNLLKKVTNYGSITEEYDYDAIGRLTSDIVTIDGTANTTTYTYTNYHDIDKVTYPSGFVADYNYDANGFLTNIKNGTGTVTLFTAGALNGLGQTKAYTLGNGKSSTRTYNYGFPTNYYTNGSGIQNLTMDWFYVTGNMKSRKDNLFNLTDEFEYDDLNRLKRSYMVTQSDIVLTYNNNGNINYKTDAGNYTYNGSKINAVSNITNQHNLVPQDEQNISYTSFFQPKILTESNKNLEYIYSHDDQRIKSVLKINNVVNTTRYYFGDYERQIKNGITSHIHYIAADPGLICIVERIGTTDNYYYTYTDHLGSILTVTNNTGTVIARQNFDSWGRKRHPVTWSYTNPPAVPDWLYRGYTGHEMVPEFGLINMNGRMYDPINGRMLSTDNYVQNPGSTQGMNRYTYAMNNPLRYTDPSGEIAIVDDILIGATIGAIVGVITNGVGNTIHNQPFFQGAGKAALWGGVAGALSGGIGGLASEMLVSGSTMIEVGLFQAVAHGWAGSAVALMQGQEPFTPFAIGIGSSITGSLLQNTHWSLQVLSGGVIGGTVSELTGGNFIDGFSTGLITAGLNHAMHSFTNGTFKNEISEEDYFNLSDKKKLKYVEVPVDAIVKEVEQVAVSTITPTGTVTVKNTDVTEIWGKTKWVREKNLIRSLNSSKCLYYSFNGRITTQIFYNTYKYYTSGFLYIMNYTGNVLYPSNVKPVIYKNRALYPGGDMTKYLNLLK